MNGPYAGQLVKTNSIENSIRGHVIWNGGLIFSVKWNDGSIYSINYYIRDFGDWILPEVEVDEWKEELIIEV